MPLFAGVAFIAFVERPRLFAPTHRLLDIALAASLAVIALQLVPLPAARRAALAPSAVAFDQAVRFDVSANPLAPAPRPLTIDATATAWALGVGVTLVVFFWCARLRFSSGGLRVAVRSIAWCGLVLGPLVLVQHATSPRMLYWLWRPAFANARPYGPFVNRNDLACWLIMAIPLTVGYLIARVQSRHRPGAPFDIEAIVDATAIWLAASICLMTAALLTTMSRSGITGAAAAAFLMVVLSRGRVEGRRGATIVVVLAAIGLAATTYANVGELATRFGDAMTEGVGGRLAIWRQSWPMIVDFWPLGVGMGAYMRGMMLYQRLPHLFFFNHAHSEYVQLVAEGGAPMVTTAGVAVLVAAAGMIRRLFADHTPIFWVRAGAVSGLAAVAVQSIWETALRMPANAVLFAIVAGVALHESPAHRHGGSPP